MNQEKIFNIVGCARTIRTTIMVTEYLRQRLGQPHTDVHPAQITYRFKESTEANGWWIADIGVKGRELNLQESKLFVDTCRAFVAGAGEVWT